MDLKSVERFGSALESVSELWAPVTNSTQLVTLSFVTVRPPAHILLQWTGDARRYA